MNALILHPTASTPVPVTHCPPAGARKPRKPRTRKPGDLTCDELRAVLLARDIKFTTKHTKAELIAMTITGVTVRAAAQDRENARRRAARAAKKAV